MSEQSHEISPKAIPRIGSVSPDSADILRERYRYDEAYYDPTRTTETWARIKLERDTEDLEKTVEQSHEAAAAIRQQYKEAITSIPAAQAAFEKMKSRETALPRHM
jgi:hypothetical protein